MTSQRRARGRRDSGARDRLVEATRSCLRRQGVAGSSSRLITQTAGENLERDHLLLRLEGGARRHRSRRRAARLGRAGARAPRRTRRSGGPARRRPSRSSARCSTSNVIGFPDCSKRSCTPLDRAMCATRSRRSGSTCRPSSSAVIGELHSSGTIPSWVQPEPMAALIVAVTAGTVVNETIAPGGVGHREVAAQFTSLLISASSNA